MNWELKPPPESEKCQLICQLSEAEINMLLNRNIICQSFGNFIWGTDDKFAQSWNYWLLYTSLLENMKIL